MLSQFKKITAIVGCQRSGTTLTGQIIGTHPNAMLIDEPDGLYNWFKKQGKMSGESGKMFEQLIENADKKYRPRHKRLRKRDGKLKPEIKHLVLKAPNLTYDFTKLAQLDKDVSILYPIRDPRSVVASMSKLKQINMVANQIDWISANPKVQNLVAEDFEKLNNPDLPIHIRRAIIWKIKTGLFEQFKEKGLNPFVFKYEDFIASPEQMCRKMADHLNMDYHHNFTQHDAIYWGMGPGFTERARPIDTISVRQWKNRLSPKQAREVIETTGELAAQFGYGKGDYAKFDKPSSHIPEDVLTAPIILTGRGGSGTRLISEIAQNADVFLGNRLNVSADSTEWADLIYEIGIARARAEAKDKPFEFRKDHLLFEKAKDVLGYGNWKPEELWGWKLPETMIAVPDVMNKFKDAKLVHLVRHPVTMSLRRTHMTSRLANPIGRAVLNAAYKEFGRDQSHIKSDPAHIHNALSWLYQVGKVHRYAADNLTAENYHLIRFEDIIEYPEPTTQALTNFIIGDTNTNTIPSINVNRVTDLDAADPRIDEVWNICGDLGSQLSYNRP